MNWRGLAYGLLKLANDLRAVRRGEEAVVRRVQRRILGKLAGRLIGKVVPPLPPRKGER